MTRRLRGRPPAIGPIWETDAGNGHKLQVVAELADGSLSVAVQTPAGTRYTTGQLIGTIYSRGPSVPALEAAGFEIPGSAVLEMLHWALARSVMLS